MSFIPQPCTGSGGEVFIDGSDCIAISGTGTDVDPFIVEPIIDPDVDNTLSCGPDGLLVSTVDIDGSNCISVTGTGTTPDPYVISPIINPVAGNTLSCGPAGLLVPTPSSGLTEIFLSSGSWFPTSGNVIINDGSFKGSNAVFTNASGRAYTQWTHVPADWSHVNVFLLWQNGIGGDLGDVMWDLGLFRDFSSAAYNLSPFDDSGLVSIAPSGTGFLTKSLLTVNSAVTGDSYLHFQVIRRGDLDANNEDQVVVGLLIQKV